jgi:hypothetical protein
MDISGIDTNINGERAVHAHQTHVHDDTLGQVTLADRLARLGVQASDALKDKLGALVHAKLLEAGRALKVVEGAGAREVQLDLLMTREVIRGQVALGIPGRNGCHLLEQRIQVINGELGRHDDREMKRREEGRVGLDALVPKDRLKLLSREGQVDMIMQALISFYPPKSKGQL